MNEPRLIVPNGVTPTQARRLADIADGLTDGGLEVEALVDVNLYDLDSERCGCCGRTLEGGHCYACSPVFGYGEGFRCSRCS